VWTGVSSYLFTNRLPFLAAITAAVGIPVTRARAQSIENSDTPPARFVRAWQQAVGGIGDSQKEGTAALATNAGWEPYFRGALNQVADQGTRNRLRPVLEKCRGQLFRWNLERAKTWADELRFDYLTDLAAATDDPKVAGAVGDHLLAMQKTVHDKYKALPFAWPGGKPPTGTRTFINFRGAGYVALSAQEGFRRFSGDYVDVPEDQRNRPALIHGRGGAIAALNSHSWISLTSTELSAPREPRRTLAWFGSVVCVNNSATLAGGYICLFVFDGDVELSNPANVSARFTECVIVANGNVKGTQEEISSNCCVYAAGDFSGKDRGYQGFGSITAGGKISPMPPDDHPARKYYKQGVKENPLGIRFVSPADAGVELDVGAKVVRLGKLADTSPLKRASLEKGDRVLTLNGVAMETAADFRRQLREALLWGTGLFEIKRGDQTFLRLVTLAEPPKK
jgi:hypothetical protein